MLLLHFVLDSCTVPEEAQDVIKHCNDFYSLDEEDRTPLNLPGWTPYTGSVDWANFSDLCPAPWRYVPTENLHNSPSWGYFDIYDGGGYVADLGYSINTAKAVISNLRKHGWIDIQTRAVLLEFTVYNPNTGYLSIATYYYEILPTGYGNPFTKIDTLLLTSTQTGFYQFYLICQLLFIIMVVFFVLREVYKIYRKKCAYFRDVWNWVEILQIIFSFLVVVFYVIKSKMVLKSALKVQENPFVPVSFGEAITWNHAENAVLAITVFIATVKLLRMIRFNPHVSIMMSSFRESKGLLLSYSVIFVIIFLSYAQFGQLAFGSDMQSYSSFQSTLFSELLMCLGGKMNLTELLRVNRILGPLFGFSFLLLMFFIFVNFFVAILNDSYEDVKKNTDKQSEEFEMADFILDRLSELLGIKKQSQQERDNDASTVHSVGNNGDNDDPELLEQQRSEESNSKKTVTFATLPVYSRRPRRIAKRKQLRDSKCLRKNEMETKLQPARLDQEQLAGAKSSKRKFQKVKLVVSSIFALDSLSQEQMFKRMDVLTMKAEKDEIRQDILLLSLIRLLQNKKNTDVFIPEATSTLLDDIEMASLVTASSLLINNIDTERSSESGDDSDDEILEFLRYRASVRPLPYHLRGKDLQEQLQSILATIRTPATRRKASDSAVSSITRSFKFNSGR